MAEFETFKLQLSPALEAPGSWKVDLQQSPVAGLEGPMGVVQPKLSRQDLHHLRNRDFWPNLAELKAIGQRVWGSIMTPQAEAAYLACRAAAHQNGKGLRIIVSAVGEEPEDAAPPVRLVELPVEAMYRVQENKFLAPDITTPISRSLHWSQDREALRIALPLRVLLVTAEPNDQPPVNAAAEVAEIQLALAKLTGPRGAVEVDVCANATKRSLGDALRAKRYHVVHFITHGKFDQTGADASQRAYLCLQSEGAGDTDAIDADTLAGRLSNTGVMLVVFTACQSAAPMPGFPTQEPFPVRAFDGLAQRLLAGATAELTAVVAMQFDLETQAAATFSRHFYGALVRPETTLDEAVALARKEIFVEMNAGHRAWVTPTVYWRCRRGKVFEFEPTRRTLSEAVLQKLGQIDADIRLNREILDSIAREPDHIRPHLEQMRVRSQQAIDSLMGERSALLGDTLRLLGGTVAPGGQVACSIRLRLRADARIGPVKLTLNLPAVGVAFRDAEVGAQGGGEVPTTAVLPGTRNLKVNVDLAPVNLGAGEHEIGILKFTVAAAAARGSVLDLQVNEAKVERDGQLEPIEALAGMLFVT